jgi:hypothetical protein
MALVHTAVEVSEFYCYNIEGDKLSCNSSVVQNGCDLTTTASTFK